MGNNLLTIDMIITERKKKYPNDCLTAWALRSLIKEGKIPCVKIGVKQLTTEEAVDKYINSQLGA